MAMSKKASDYRKQLNRNYDEERMKEILDKVARKSDYQEYSGTEEIVEVSTEEIQDLREDSIR